MDSVQDYWEEVRTLRGVEESVSGGDKSNDELDDAELETTFFESLGLSVSTSSQELSEENVNSNSFMGTLTNRQEEALKRRVRTLNATLRQKRHRSKQNKTDIRSFFSSTDASSTGTRSRSATPDSLDSVSPPHTPPDPNPKTWVDPYLSRSRGSLDSGNHSLVTIPCYQPSSSPITVNVSSFEPPTTLVTVTNYLQQDHYHQGSTSNYQPDSTYPSVSNYHSSSGAAFDNNRSTSIVTVSSYSNGSSSPVSSDTNGGRNVQSKYNKSSSGQENTSSSNNNKYKYSRTYISQDNNSEPYSHNTILIENAQRDNRYSANNSGYNSNKSYTTSIHRSYSKSHSIKEKNGQQYNENSNKEYKRRSCPPDCEGDQSAETDWDDTATHSSRHHRYVHYPEGRLTVLPRAPSLDRLSMDCSPEKTTNIRRQKSYARDIAKDVKLYYTKGVYELKPQAYHPEDPSREVQALRYQHIGSMHIPRCKESRPHLYQATSEQQEVNASSTDSGSGLPGKHVTGAQPIPLTDRRSNTDAARSRSSSTTDLGFKAIYENDEIKFPELVLEVGRTGQTRMDWLHESDLLKLKSLALLELEIIFADHNISHGWRNSKKKKIKEADHGVFGVSIPTLLERDSHQLGAPCQLASADPCQLASVPQIFSKLVSHLQLQGVQEVGILRIPGNSSKTELLRTTIDTHFYSSPDIADAALREAVPNELVAIIKMFLRMLPEPLLTKTYMPAFYKAHKISPLEERVVALTMLLLLLPTPHRETLRALLDLCARVVEHERVNKMGLNNVATIMAPNLFPPEAMASKGKLKNEDADQLIAHAKCSCELSQMLIKYRDVLWTVPHRLLGQIRRQYQAIRVIGTTPISRLLSRRIHKDVHSYSGYVQGGQGCSTKVYAPQLTKQHHAVHLTHSLTVGQLLNRLLEEESQRSGSSSSRRVEGRREQQNQLTSLGMCIRHPPLLPSQGTWCRPPTGGAVPALTCLLRGPQHALQQHALHERGGNISERRLDPDALLLAVYQDNPSVELLVRCHHPGGYTDYLDTLLAS